MIGSRPFRFVSMSLAIALAVSGCQSGNSKQSSDEKHSESGTAPAKAPVEVHREYNDTARFIAGLPPEPGSLFAEHPSDLVAGLTAVG